MIIDIYLWIKSHIILSKFCGNLIKPELYFCGQGCFFDRDFTSGSEEFFFSLCPTFFAYSFWSFFYLDFFCSIWVFSFYIPFYLIAVWFWISSNFFILWRYHLRFGRLYRRRPFFMFAFKIERVWTLKERLELTNPKNGRPQKVFELFEFAIFNRKALRFLKCVCPQSFCLKLV